MRLTLQTLLVLMVAPLLSADDQPHARLSEMTPGQKVTFVYTQSNCWGYPRECAGSIVRSKQGWKISARMAEEPGKFHRKTSARLSEEEIADWDLALLPKEYGEDDIIMSGGFGITITWPDGFKQTLGGSSDADKLAPLVGRHFRWKEPNQPPQTTPVSAPR